MGRRLAMMAVLAALTAGCAAQAARPGARPTVAGSDPRTATALLRIATVFNNDYDGGDYGPV